MHRSPAPFEVAEDADVVDDQPASLSGAYAVRARDRLHQRVVLHRLVEVDGRARRHVEAGDPHGADEDQAQRIVGVLELRRPGPRSSSARDAAGCRALACISVDLVLRLADDDRHVGARRSQSSCSCRAHALVPSGQPRRSASRSASASACQCCGPCHTCAPRWPCRWRCTSPCRDSRGPRNAAPGPAAILSSRSSRVIRWYWRANSPCEPLLLRPRPGRLLEIRAISSSRSLVGQLQLGDAGSRSRAAPSRHPRSTGRSRRSET